MEPRTVLHPYQHNCATTPSMYKGWCHQKSTRPNNDGWRVPPESWTRICTDGSATAAIKDGGAGIYIQHTNGRSDSVSVATGKHCTNHKAGYEAIMTAWKWKGRWTGKAWSGMCLAREPHQLQGEDLNNQISHEMSVKQGWLPLPGQEGANDHIQASHRS